MKSKDILIKIKDLSYYDFFPSIDIFPSSFNLLICTQIIFHVNECCASPEPLMAINEMKASPLYVFLTYASRMILKGLLVIKYIAITVLKSVRA